MGAIVFGHRGASIEQPENTLESFAVALELGVDVLETDVHLTSDGHVVVHHDDTGERMACERRPVAGCTLAEVKRWNVAFGFRGRDGQGISDRSARVPTLDEALDAFPTARFNIDIKPLDATAAVMRVVERHRAEGRVLLTSFHDAVTTALHDAGYAGEKGLSRGEVVRALVLPSWAPASTRPRGQRIQIPTSIGGIPLAKPSTIRRLQGLGLRVDFWVLNDPSTAREVAAMGADGIMTDDPRGVAPAVRSA